MVIVNFVFTCYNELCKGDDIMKQNAINAISSLPENASLEDIMYRLYILGKHEKALDDISNNRVLSTEEVRQSILVSP